MFKDFLIECLIECLEVYECLSFENILSRYHVLMIFISYQTIHSIRYECKLLPTKFHKDKIYNSEENKVSSVILVAYSDIYV